MTFLLGLGRPTCTWELLGLPFFIEKMVRDVPWTRLGLGLSVGVVSTGVSPTVGLVDYRERAGVVGVVIDVGRDFCPDTWGGKSGR